MNLEPEWIRFGGIACGILGTILLSWRVTRILRALSLVASCHELNLQSLVSSQQVVVQMTNSDKHVERAKGTGLLVLGFVLIIFGLILQGVATYVDVDRKAEQGAAEQPATAGESA